MNIDTYAAKTQLSRLLALAEAGEEVVITRRGTPVARLVAVSPKPPRRLGLLKGRIEMAPDFDATPAELIAAFEGDDPA